MISKVVQCIRNALLMISIVVQFIWIAMLIISIVVPCISIALHNDAFISNLIPMHC